MINIQDHCEVKYSILRYRFIVKTSQHIYFYTKILQLHRMMKNSYIFEGSLRIDNGPWVIDKSTSLLFNANVGFINSSSENAWINRYEYVYHSCFILKNIQFSIILINNLCILKWNASWNNLSILYMHNALKYQIQFEVCIHTRLIWSCRDISFI